MGMHYEGQGGRSVFWFSAVAVTISLIFLLCAPRSILAEDNDAPTIAKLSFCGDSENRDISRRLLYVSTLDGSLTALDLENSGKLKWTLKTGPDPLLSSSIHRFELTNNGQMVRMIPSLYGGLYKFDGDDLEQIPVTADHLLSSSYKFSDDLVISGGKETRSYGVSARTGRIVYECSLHGCKNATELEVVDIERHGPPREFKLDEDREHDPMLDDIVVIRRETQTVRAVEPRTGGERWNFSVGHHELEILKPHDCHNRPQSQLDQTLSSLLLKVIVPDGVVCAVDKDAPEVILWQYKFEHPIVNAWKTNSNDVLETVNTFNFFQFPVKRAGPMPSFDVQPSVYVGMYNKQLYIQESQTFKKELIDNHLDGLNRNYLKIPWKPHAAKPEIALIEHDPSDDGIDGALAVMENSVTALSILYATEYANGNGFFLFSASDLNRTSSCDKEHKTRNENDSDDPFDFPFAADDTPTQIIIVSLWYWWKEIMVISLTTALILNVVLSRRITTSREVVIVERHVEIKVPMPAEPIEDVDTMWTRRSLSESQQSDSMPYVSRYKEDFDMVQCLGKGGFGVVFESKNKLDDCRYAIKRILLPRSQESRDRVMREVKTLAHCEHQHIVRYFQAWVETPPPGWQEQEDRIWMDSEALSHSIEIDSPTPDTTKNLDKVFSKAIHRNGEGLESWISNLNTNECINFDDDNRKTAFVDDESCEQFIEDSSDSNVLNQRHQNGHSVISVNDDSFSIEFEKSKKKRSASRHFSSGDGLSVCNGVNDDDDSFQIEFVDSQKGHNETSCDLSANSEDSSECEEEDDDEEEEDSFRIEFNADCSDSIVSKPNDRKAICKKTRNTNTSADDSFQIEFKNDHDSESSPKMESKFFANQSSLASTDYDFSQNSAVFADDTDEHESNGQVANMKKTQQPRPTVLDLVAANGTTRRKADRMYLYIQMQLCKKQSLKDWLRINDSQTRKRDIVSIFRQIVDGVEYCHLKGLIHRDLKPGNIFFSLDGQIKIGDFGLVTGISDIPNTPCNHQGQHVCVKHTQQVGTQLYMSPEQMEGKQYSYKVDIYSLGLIFFELLVVFGTEMERIDTLKALRNSIFPKDFFISFQNEYELLKLMLSRSPDERPTTIGIRARPPLGFTTSNTSTSNAEYHFELPPRRRDSHMSGLSSATNASTIDSGSNSK